MDPHDIDFKRLVERNKMLLSPDHGRGDAVRFSPESAATGMADSSFQQESIVLRTLRPVFSILRDDLVPIYADPEDRHLWNDKLTKARAALTRATRAVGRVELEGDDWFGTGWLVGPDLLVTNRHVANALIDRNRLGGTFTQGPIALGKVDFLREIDNSERRVFRLLEPVHIEPWDGPDVAFIRVEQVAGRSGLAPHITLAAAFERDAFVAVIGYPAYDARIPDIDLMERIFGRIYGKKRLAPGRITGSDDLRIEHDCTTLGGNSGSVLLDLDSGNAVGLHFAGRFLDTNLAVRADVVQRLLNSLNGPRPSPQDKAKHPKGASSSGDPGGLKGAVAPDIPRDPVGNALLPSDRQGPSASPPIPAPRKAVQAADYQDDPVGPEGRIEDYRDRKGYVPDFLGRDLCIKLPSIPDGRHPVLTFPSEGKNETELRYEHFSVVMHEERRMCLFSACNIDGKLSRRTGRSRWRLDPRIKPEFQIMAECYGSFPKFSRGHMTRREDPAWGNPVTACRGSDDSMHVTNAVPQMQAFNSPIWLGLEDYALQNAREDDMRISVFTGPFFDLADPIRFGVRIPRTFWKIIAFRHDETGHLCATGYEMDQSANIPAEEEYIFGDYVPPRVGRTVQTSIQSIQTRAGIIFGSLAKCDPLGIEEAASPMIPISQFSQIRLR